MTKIAVVALGGNALTRLGQSGTAAEMAGNAAAMAASVNDVIEAGWRVVIVHGNGPQVGNLALQQEATTEVPAQPGQGVATERNHRDLGHGILLVEVVRWDESYR